MLGASQPPPGDGSRTTDTPLPASRACSAHDGTATLEQLAVAARAGKPGAAEELCDRARRCLVTVARSLGVPSAEVPDLVQEVLLAAWRRLDRYDPARGSFIGWLTPGLRGRAYNLGRGELRRSRFLRRLRVLPGALDRERPDPRSRLEARLTLEVLLATLTRCQRAVLELYDLGGLSSGETARVLDIAPAGVRSIARDARRRLRLEAERLAAGRSRDPAPGEGPAGQRGAAGGLAQ